MLNVSPLPAALLLDLDDTAYAYRPCHRAGLDLALQTVAASGLGLAGKDDAARAYGRARERVHARLAGQAASHCRLLYFKELVEERARQTSIGLVRELHAQYWLGYFGAMRRDEGCAEVLRALKEAGVRLAWVTNFTTERQMLKLDALGLETAAHLLVSSEEAGREKPDPAVLNLALERLQVRARDAWFVGDDLELDSAAAKRAEVSFLWFRREAGSARAESVQAEVRSWSDLGRFFGLFGALDPADAST